MSLPYDIEIGDKLRKKIFLDFTHHDEAYKQ